MVREGLPSPYKERLQAMEITEGMKAAVKPTLWGIVIGAIACAFIGFQMGGWVTSSKA